MWLVILYGCDRITDKDIYNETPLLFACFSGNLEIVTLLFEFGAELEDSMPESDDPLIASIWSGNEKVVEWILTHAGEIYTHPWHRNRIISIFRFWETTKSLNYKQRDKADMQSTLSKWDRIFRIICQHLNFEDPIGFKIRLDPVAASIAETNESLIRLELERMCCVGSADSFRELLENLPMHKEFPEWIRTSSGPSCSTLLHWAALNTSSSILSYLLELGLSPDSQDINGDTPLHLAARQQKEAHIRALIRFNADRRICCGTGQRAFHCAILTMPPCASTNILNQLIVDSSDINSQGIDGLYPIHQASLNGSFAALKWLLGQGADVNVRDDCERTVSHCAAYSRSLASVEILEYLINHGHDVAVQDLTNITPLHDVLYGCDAEGHMDGPDIAFAKVKCLLRNGADVNAQDIKGNTPLHLAVWKSHKTIVRLLLRAGAQTSRTDYMGLTAIEMARDDEIREMIEMSGLDN